MTDQQPVNTTSKVEPIDQQLQPPKPAPAKACGCRRGSQPVIVVEPVNDESLRCDCRNCQFFSGWCCTPCVLFIILLFIFLIWLIIHKSSADEHAKIDHVFMNITKIGASSNSTSTIASTGTSSSTTSTTTSATTTTLFD